MLAYLWVLRAVGAVGGAGCVGCVGFFGCVGCAGAWWYIELGITQFAQRCIVVVLCHFHWLSCLDVGAETRSIHLARSHLGARADFTFHYGSCPHLRLLLMLFYCRLQSKF